MNLHRREIRLRFTKNGKERLAPITNDAMFVLSEMSGGKLKGRDLLFPDVTPTQVSVAFARVLKAVGIRNRSFHSLRHTYASHASMNGVPLHTLQKLLGHSDPRMTNVYSHLSQSHLLDEAKKLDGVLMLSDGFSKINCTWVTIER